MTRLVLVFAILVCALPLGVRSSGATFVAASANPGARFAAAADFNTVSVSLARPGHRRSAARVTLSASAASNRGIASVTLQSSPAGDEHLDRRLPRDRPRRSRAPSTPRRSPTGAATSARWPSIAPATRAPPRSTGRLIDNTAPSSPLTDPGRRSPARDADGDGRRRRLGPRDAQPPVPPRGGGAWTDVCRRTSSPASCSSSRPRLAGRPLRLPRRGDRRRRQHAARRSSPARRVDNTAPTIAFSGPGAAIRGQVADRVDAGRRRLGHRARSRYQVRAVGRRRLDRRLRRDHGPVQLRRRHDAGPRRPLRGARDRDRRRGPQHHVRDDHHVDRQHRSAPPHDDRPRYAAGRRRDARRRRRPTPAPASPRCGSSAPPPARATWTDGVQRDDARRTACSWGTTAAADGLYDLRAVATDAAGNTRADRRPSPAAGSTTPARPSRSPTRARRCARP